MKILILVKTCPHSSSQMNETTCAAGITETGDWIKFYTIPYCYLTSNQQFKIFDWVECNIERTGPENDHQQENYRADADSIRIIGHLVSAKDVFDRYDRLIAIEKYSLEDLQEAHKASGVSLGAFKPGIMHGLIFKKNTNDWTNAQKAQLSQISLFADPTTIAPLKKVPYEIYVSFESAGSGIRHKIKLTEWEYNYTFLKLLQKYPNNPAAAMTELNHRWMKNFTDDRFGYLFAETSLIQDHFNTFIIGHVGFANAITLPAEQLVFL